MSRKHINILIAPVPSAAQIIASKACQDEATWEEGGQRVAGGIRAAEVGEYTKLVQYSSEAISLLATLKL